MLCCLFISQTEAYYPNYFFKEVLLAIVFKFISSKNGPLHTFFFSFGSMTQGPALKQGGWPWGHRSEVRGLLIVPKCTSVVAIDLNFALLLAAMIWGVGLPGRREPGEGVSPPVQRQLPAQETLHLAHGFDL